MVPIIYSIVSPTFQNHQFFSDNFIHSLSFFLPIREGSSGKLGAELQPPLVKFLVLFETSFCADFTRQLILNIMRSLLTIFQVPDGASSAVAKPECWKFVVRGPSTRRSKQLSQIVWGSFQGRGNLNGRRSAVIGNCIGIHFITSLYCPELLAPLLPTIILHLHSSIECTQIFPTWRNSSR